MRAGVRVRICVGDPATPDVAGGAAGQSADDTSTAHARGALGRYVRLRESGAEIRLHQEVLYNSIYRADDELLVGQHAYGIPAGRAPVLHLRRASGGDMVITYLEILERTWATARPLA